jgi:hypothetical protein
MSAMASRGWKGEKYLKYGMKAEQSSARPGLAVPQNHPPESITTCTIKEDYDPARVEFSSDADFAAMLSVKKDQHAFAIGNPIPGTIPKILISLGDGKGEGYVPLKYLQKGTSLRPVQVKQFAPQYKTAVTAGDSTGEVLFRTIDALLDEMKERREDLERVGCNFEALQEISSDSQNLSATISRCKSPCNTHNRCR